MSKTLTRPQLLGGSHVTTPNVASVMSLLGPGYITNGVALTGDEMRAIRKLYGFRLEKKNKRPPPPKAPAPLPENASWVERRQAEEKYKAELAQHANWQDPRELLQAGADWEAIRCAQLDGLRIIAWLAKHTEEGTDPLKAVIQAAVAADWDVEPEDCDWAHDYEPEPDGDVVE